MREIALGLCHGSHDVAAAVVVDGALEVMVEQERISGRRYAAGESPVEAGLHALDWLGAGLADVGIVALGSDHAELARFLGPKRGERSAQLPYDPEERLRRGGLPDDTPVLPVPHHLAHAHSAFWPSGLERAAVLIMDAMGDSESTSLGVASRSGGIRLGQRLGVGQSLGYFYEAACRYVGFGDNSAGKLMGLSAYGTPYGPLAETPAHEAAAELDEGTCSGRDTIRRRVEGLLTWFTREYFPYSRGRGNEPMTYADFAASAQRSLELSIAELALASMRLADCGSLVMAGGVALNCAANALIADMPDVDALFVQPASVDSGTAIGAAYAACGRDQLAFRGRRSFSPFLGLDQLEGEVDAAVLHIRDAETRRLDSASDLVGLVARQLADGRIVAWHQGRSEIGPRALGARSLLADPRKRSSAQRLNRAKERESWRPVAPSVLVDAFGHYFEGVPNAFMLVAAKVKPEVRSVIPAVVHVDGSARPQAVDRSFAPRYHDLLVAFADLTGCPVLANTSLNSRHRAPSTSAIGTVDFFNSTPDVDVLALGNWIAVRC